MNIVLDAHTGETAMLPITTHRSFHVPHTLAIAAALIAMIAAFGWNASAPKALAERETEQGIEAMAETGAGRDEVPEHGTASVPGRSGSCSNNGGCIRDHGLFPLVLPALPSR